MTGVARTLLTLAVLLVAGLVAAQGGVWAVQVVALRDYVEAQAAVTQLKDLGFPAYTEFAMDDGRQFVRVRVGCYGTREAAAAMAQALRGRVTADAQAVELTPGVGTLGCVEESVGFLNGYGWRLIDDAGPVSFDVNVAGVPATVVHDGDRWRMVQDGAEPPARATPNATAAFVSWSVGGSTFVVLDGPSERVVVCPGDLIAQVGDVAIVERGDVVLACRMRAGALP